jgi:transposase InsO family protein
MSTFHNDGDMNIIMKNVTFANMEEVRDFLAGNKKREFETATREDKYKFVTDILVTLSYRTLRKKDKSAIKECIGKITGYGGQQIKRLIKKWKKKGLRFCKRKKTGAVVPKYTAKDIALLIKTDIAHKTPNGYAVREILKREFFFFGKEEYQTIAGISTSHIYNIRKNKKQYLSSEAVRYSKTVPTAVPIGERRKPRPEGKPGFLRVDSVHQGDFEGEKGVYHINIVDEITQMEIVGCVENISDECMIPLLLKLIEQFPFIIQNFHSDNGSEYINRQVASMLERLLIKQTKSRPRHSNDNGLAETKNGSVIRKHIGRNHIPKKNAPAIEMFYEQYFNPYLCFHRMCAFATEYTDKRGKIRKKYETYTSPYERFKNIPSAEQYLKPGISFEQLDKIAYAQSDNECAEKMEKEKKEVLKNLKS